MYDPFLTPIVATWPTRTCEEVREALQSIPATMHDCSTCGWPFTSELSAAECCEPPMGLD